MTKVDWVDRDAVFYVIGKFFVAIALILLAGTGLLLTLFGGVLGLPLLLIPLILVFFTIPIVAHLIGFRGKDLLIIWGLDIFGHFVINFGLAGLGNLTMILGLLWSYSVIIIVKNYL